MMKLDMVLPGFRMFNAFFSDLNGAFEPIVCSSAEKREYVDALQALTGWPVQAFDALREDLKLTAQVREVRCYGKDRTFARFEFMRLDPNISCRGPFQFLALFDDRRNLVSYTVMQGRGVFSEGLVFLLTRVRYDWSCCRKTEDPIEALKLLDSEDAPEVQIVDKASGCPRAFIYGGMGVRKCGFDIEWYVACEPWILMLKDVGFDVVENLVFTLKDEGVKAFEDAADWAPFDYGGRY